MITNRWIIQVFFCFLYVVIVLLARWKGRGLVMDVVGRGRGLATGRPLRWSSSGDRDPPALGGVARCCAGARSRGLENSPLTSWVWMGMVTSLFGRAGGQRAGGTRRPPFAPGPPPSPTTPGAPTQARKHSHSLDGYRLDGGKSMDGYGLGSMDGYGWGGGC